MTKPVRNASSIASIFSRGPVILDSKDHAYNPCHDVIFPTIVKTAGRIRNPLDASTCTTHPTIRRAASAWPMRLL